MQTVIVCRKCGVLFDGQLTTLEGLAKRLCPACSIAIVDQASRTQVAPIVDLADERKRRRPS